MTHSLETGGIHPNFRFIITGGPGSGKTSLVEALQNNGYKAFPEIARELISGGMTPPIRPESSPSGRFFELILRERIKCHQQITGSEIAFYDRAIPDSVIYFTFLGKRVPQVLWDAIETYRYHSLVFAAPPWEAIYRNDAVRTEEFSRAAELYEIGLEVYRKAGYRVSILPCTPVIQRVEYILEAVRSEGGRQAAELNFI